MTKIEMLEKLRKLARIESCAPGIEDIVITIYMEDDDYEEFLKWARKEEKEEAMNLI